MLEQEDCSGQGMRQAELHKEAIDPSLLEPLVFKKNFDAFKSVAFAFAEAERRVKLVEWIDGVDVPSINELRYVSYHLLKACQQSDESAQYEELRRAERHCKRASFDALELGIITALEKMDEFRSHFKDFPISDVLPDYNYMMHEAQEARDFLAEASGGEFRDEYYESCEKKVDCLKVIVRKLYSAEEEINKKRMLFYAERDRADAAERRADAAEEHAKQSLRIAQKRLKLAIASIIVAVVIGFWSFVDFGEGQVLAEQKNPVDVQAD